MSKYVDVDLLLGKLPDDLSYKASVKRVLIQAPTADVVPKSEVAREIEKFEQQVGKIYNRYVFEDTDYADDDVAIEAVINALTDVLNDLADFKKKYTEGENGTK